MGVPRPWQGSSVEAAPLPPATSAPRRKLSGVRDMCCVRGACCCFGCHAGVTKGVGQGATRYLYIAGLTPGEVRLRRGSKGSRVFVFSSFLSLCGTANDPVSLRWCNIGLQPLNFAFFSQLVYRTLRLSINPMLRTLCRCQQQELQGSVSIFIPPHLYS